MEKTIILFTVEKETKNTIRYAEQTDGKPPIVGTLYIQKWAKPGVALVVTIEEAPTDQK